VIRPFPDQKLVIASHNPGKLREFAQLFAPAGLEVISAGVKTMIDNPQWGFYLVVELDNGIQASLMVTTEWSDWRNGMFWWIQSVYVRPEYRRQGLYRELYERVKELAEQEPSVCGFRLYVERDNATAQKTYMALGMSETEYRIYEELIPKLEYRE